MKVLCVNMSIDPVLGGGTAERTLQLTRAFLRKGVDVSILTTDQGLTATVRKGFADLDVFVIRNLSRRFYIPAISFKRLKQLVAKFDIVHVMNHWTLLNALVCLAARSLRKPYVICPAGALRIYGRSKLIKFLYNYLSGKRIITEAAGHVAISPNELPFFQSYGIAPERVTIIPNGINVQDFGDDDADAFRRKHGLEETPFILFVGRLNDIKGPDLLLGAFGNIQERHPRYHLVFVGPDGGMLQELRKAVSTRGLEDCVHFIGYVGGFQKSQAYHAADLLVVPSRHEAMSIVALEAGIAGTAVLLTEQCGFDELSQVGGGRVVPSTVEGIQGGLLEMLSDPEGLKTMGVKLHEHVVNNHTWDTVADRYVDMSRRILFGNLN